MTERDAYIDNIIDNELQNAYTSTGTYDLPTIEKALYKAFDFGYAEGYKKGQNEQNSKGEGINER